MEFTGVINFHEETIMNDDTLRIFVGYDSREHDAYKVCVRSLLKHSTIPVVITPLDERRLRHAGTYTRNWSYKDGQFTDNIDHKSFSTTFSFTRFLVPSLCQWYGLALYCDCDFLWRGDVSFLFKEHDLEKAVSVVKHNHNPSDIVKMEGQRQTRYYRKNWSSLILYNCYHPSNLMLTPSAVNGATGQWLHGFSWLHDQEIGDIDGAWNCLSGIDLDIDNPLAVHFTNGTPSMKGHENDPYADEWRSVLRES
jgi:hypothetical protein